MVKSPLLPMQETRDAGLILGSGRSPGRGNGNPLQYSCLKNPMNRGGWQVAVHGVTRVRHDLATKSHTHTHTHTGMKVKTPVRGHCIPVRMAKKQPVLARNNWSPYTLLMET